MFLVLEFGREGKLVMRFVFIKRLMVLLFSVVVGFLWIEV